MALRNLAHGPFVLGIAIVLYSSDGGELPALVAPAEAAHSSWLRFAEISGLERLMSPPPFGVSCRWLRQPSTLCCWTSCCPQLVAAVASVAPLLLLAGVGDRQTQAKFRQPRCSALTSL